jgi:hypothetical protein
MKRLTTLSAAIILITLLSATAAFSQSATAKKKGKPENAPELKTYVIKRDIPDAGNLTAEQLKAISQTSCSVLKEMGRPRIEWLHSYVTGNNIYCVYKAENEEAIREHATKGGFPANEIIEVKNIISPATAELPAESNAKKKL